MYTSLDMEQPNRFDVLSGGVEDPNINQDVRDRLQQLPKLSLSEVFSLKAQVESELSGLFDRLQRQGADLNSSLVTPDGFPRSDVDVLQIRLLRRSINMLRNDLKAVITRTEELIAGQFEKLAAKTQRLEEDNELEYRVPFALVTDVVDMGPSHLAGLLKSDKIISFGHVHAGTRQPLTAIGSLVQKSEGKAVPVRVIRDKSILKFILTPSRDWAGPGLLGCRLDLV